MRHNVKMQSLPTQQGLTLLEVMLVLAIAVSIVLIGLRQYQLFRQQQLAIQLQAQVDTLFQGMAHYYQANCRGAGKLSPSTMTYPPTASFPVSIANLSGFISKSWNKANPLVNQANGYILQFNPIVATRNISTRFNFPGASVPVSSTPAEEIKRKNSVIIWRSQVAVRMTDTARIAQYQGFLGANCVSSINGNIVTPCSASDGRGQYLVWDRLPTIVAANINSGLGTSIARVNQFNQQYTNDDFYALNVEGASWNPTTDILYDVYLCGG